MDSMHSAPEIGIWSRVRKKDLPTGSKKFHYSWNFDDGETGFVVHRKNQKGYKMFYDANGNEIRDKDDILISKGEFVEGFEDVKPGKLLPKKVDGVITAKPFQSHSDDHDHDHDHQDHDHHDDLGHDMATGINALGIEHLSLLNADGAMVCHDHGDAHNHDHSMM